MSYCPEISHSRFAHTQEHRSWLIGLLLRRTFRIIMVIGLFCERDSGSGTPQNIGFPPQKTRTERRKNLDTNEKTFPFPDIFMTWFALQEVSNFYKTFKLCVITYKSLVLMQNLGFTDLWKLQPIDRFCSLERNLWTKIVWWKTEMSFGWLDSYHHFIFMVIFKTFFSEPNIQI